MAGLTYETAGSGFSREVTEADRRIAQIANANGGVFTRDQALVAGFTPKMIANRVKTGVWARIYQGVFALGRPPTEYRARLLAAHLRLRGQAIVGYRSAARVWGLEGIDWDGLEFIVAETNHSAPPKGITVHRTPLGPHDVRPVGPLLVTGVERTIMDLPAVVSEIRVEAALDCALFKRLTTLGRLRSKYDQVSRPGRAGTQLLRKILHERDPEDSAAQSILETRLWRFILDSNLPRPVHQHLVTDGRSTAFLDLAWPDAKVGVEGHGLDYHYGRPKTKDDLRRRNWLLQMGWRIFYELWEDLDDRANEIFARLSEALLPKLFLET